MTITLGYWMIPIIITAIVCFWPVEKLNDDLGVKALIEGVVKIIATLVVWLIYFAILAFI